MVIIYISFYFDFSLFFFLFLFIISVFMTLQSRNCLVSMLLHIPTVQIPLPPSFFLPQFPKFIKFIHYSVSIIVSGAVLAAVRLKSCFPVYATPLHILTVSSFMCANNLFVVCGHMRILFSG